MNSRDAAYDEEEQLRRAIEASKGEKTESTDGGTRRAKRGRSDSEEYVASHRLHAIQIHTDDAQETRVLEAPTNALGVAVTEEGNLAVRGC